MFYHTGLIIGQLREKRKQEKERAGGAGVKQMTLSLHNRTGISVFDLLMLMSLHTGEQKIITDS